MGCEPPQIVPVLLLPMGVPEEGICSQVRARRKVCGGAGLPVVQTQVEGKEKTGLTAHHATSHQCHLCKMKAPLNRSHTPGEVREKREQKKGFSHSNFSQALC